MSPSTCPQVCSLVYVCLSRLYTTGDLLPVYSRVNELQVFLQDKHSTAPEVCAQLPAWVPHSQPAACALVLRDCPGHLLALMLVCLRCRWPGCQPWACCHTWS